MGCRSGIWKEGTGPGVVLLHGASLGSSGDVFARNLAPLAAGGLRVIAPDRRGMGAPGGPDDPTLAGHRRFALGSWTRWGWRAR